MQDLVTKISFNKKLGEKYFLLGVDVPWKSFVPGQFVMLSVPNVFLRRPFGILSIEKGILTICYKVVGKGTEALSQLENGCDVSILGPLGNGFNLDKDDAVLVAGGYGVVPMYALADRLVKMGRAPIFLYGAKTEADLVLLDWIKKLGVDCKISTEDGSKGVKGTITVILEEVLSNNPKYKVIYTCGPKGLLKEVCRIGHVHGKETFVSAEEFMACGFGVCLGCVCRNKDGKFVRVCKDGPVFSGDEIELEK